MPYASQTPEVIIVGAGIGGLTLALALHRVGISCRIFEAAPEIHPIGAGINLLPHATRELACLGLEPALERRAITTRSRAFYNRFGQLVYREPLGREGGSAHPQYSMHRADLQSALLEAVFSRCGSECVVLGQRCTEVSQDADRVTVHLVACETGAVSEAPGRLAVAADGIHSAVRRQLFPAEGPPRYSGVNMWRGVTRWLPILDGATMVLAGCLATGQAVIYPVRDRIDALGRQLVNWVFEVDTADYLAQDWNRPGRLEDFLPVLQDWQFPWLDVPALMQAADVILEFPMVDRDPLPRWSFGRITLLGDAAHPMVPRGSNGACQAILDAVALAECVSRRDSGNVETTLIDYEAQRLEPTAQIVMTNRSEPPDVILDEVRRRTGDRPFVHIEDVISGAEISAMIENYKRISTAN